MAVILIPPQIQQSPPHLQNWILAKVLIWHWDCYKLVDIIGGDDALVDGASNLQTLEKQIHGHAVFRAPYAFVHCMGNFVRNL